MRARANTHTHCLVVSSFLQKRTEHKKQLKNSNTNVYRLVPQNLEWLSQFEWQTLVNDCNEILLDIEINWALLLWIEANGCPPFRVKNAKQCPLLNFRLSLSFALVGSLSDFVQFLHYPKKYHLIDTCATHVIQLVEAVFFFSHSLYLSSSNFRQLTKEIIPIECDLPLLV